MRDLRVIGVESGALLVASDEGQRYRIAIDEVLQSKLRKAIPDPGTGRKLAPKDIQSHIRSGMSAQDVASITGVPLDYIQRFEGPVLAEREYVIESALAVPVHTAMDTDPMDQGSTFGSVIMSRLHELSATGERWASWKEEGTGWIVKLSFTSEQIDHDARWHFEPKKSALAPLNAEAITLSQQGELTGSLIPRLRAVDARDRVEDSSRFDSGAFVDSDLGLLDTAPHREAIPFGRIGAVPHATELLEHTEDDSAPTNQTADLLEALRRRRGERESIQYDELEDARSDHPSTGSIRLVDVPLPSFEEEPNSTQQHSTQPQNLHQRAAKKGRATMPSWDEIVFGARSDDDPA
jgi:hypothetical protein